MFACFIWLGLHLFLILGVYNWIIVFIILFYSYFNYDQSLRLIFKEFYRPKTPVDQSKQQQVTPQKTTEAV
jgi:NADH dehydrogenase